MVVHVTPALFTYPVLLWIFLSREQSAILFLSPLFRLVMTNTKDEIQIKFLKVEVATVLGYKKGEYL